MLFFGFSLVPKLAVAVQGTGFLFSTTFRYSLISLVELASAEHTLQARQIANKYALSHHYLSVVMRELRLLGLVDSSKGNRGGYRLARAADKINLLDLYNSLAGGNSDEYNQKNQQSASPADAWLQYMITNWSQDLRSISLQDLCKYPNNRIKHNRIKHN